jgi:hypothetical protein
MNEPFWLTSAAVCHSTEFNMKTLCSFLLLLAACGSNCCEASSLEELLGPSSKKVELSSVKANEAWRGVVEAFQKNDMAKATELGKAFLTGDFKPSAYQLLGVKVMMGLAGGGDGTQVFENPQDAAEKKKLEEERAVITKRYQELNAVHAQADARINELTLNRRRPVQQGSPNHLECLQCAKTMDTALAELEVMKPKIEENKRKTAELASKATTSLKPQTLQLLDMLIEANEIEAAAAIGNTYVRAMGNDLEVAKKQQDVVRLQEVADKATKAVAILLAEVGALVEKKMYWEARDKTQVFLGKVEQMSTDADLLRMVRAKVALDPLGVERNIRAGEESVRLIQAQADVNFTRAFEEFENLRVSFPDHPQRLELDLYIAKRKVNVLDEILAGLHSDFEEMEKRFDPEKLQVFYSRSAAAAADKTASMTKEREVAVAADTERPGLLIDGREVAGAASIEKVGVSTKENEAGVTAVQELLEMGLAPADSRLVKAKLEGMAAAMALVEKMGLPADRDVKFAGMKAKVRALLVLMQ